jgi:hypothetical protein
MEDVVEVLDLTFVTTTPGLTLHHTIRAHEGDALVEDGSGALRIQFGPRKVMAGNEERTLPGRKVTIQAGHIVEMTVQPRMELKERPTAKALIDREKAELDDLKKKHGLTAPPKGK